MAISLAALEKLFTELVMGAIPEGTPTRTYWDGAHLCLDVELMPDGELSGHTIKLSMTADAIREYAGATEAQRLKAEANLTRYIYKRFGTFFADRAETQHDDHLLTEWKIMGNNLRT